MDDNSSRGLVAILRWTAHRRNAEHSDLKLRRPRSLPLIKKLTDAFVEPYYITEQS